MMSIDYILSRFNSFSLGTKGLTPQNLPERIQKEFTYIPRSKTLVVSLPAWTHSIDRQKSVKRYVTSLDESFLAYDFPHAILSSDYQLTKECLEIVREIVKKEITDLNKKYNFTRCILIGSSLGVVSASMIASGNPEVDEIVLITAANCLAEAMWTGCRTQHLRKAYEGQGISLSQLKNYWYNLAPEHNLDLTNKKISVFISRAYKIIFPELGEKLVEEMKAKGLNPILKENKHLGHCLTLEYFYTFPEKFLNLCLARRSMA